ncbi:MAG: glycosyltransferase family 39 protein [Leptospiraceae bacterium]|nr:glycosyltransferase family 39 protein [Leptospiraceae bacterium]
MSPFLRRHGRFYLFILTVTGLRLALALTQAIHPDEAYYWVWSTKPDWAYYDHAPGVAYYILFFTTLFGDTHFALKLAASFATLPVLLFCYHAMLRLEFGRARIWLVLLAMTIIPGFMGGSFFTVPDTPLMIFWTMALLVTIRYIQERRALDLYLMMIALALGALSKYNMIGFGFTLILWFILNPREYYLLKNKHFWIGAGIALCMLSPILIWNLKTDWGTLEAVQYMRSAAGRSNRGLAPYIVGQMLSFSPLWWLAFMALMPGLGIWILTRRWKALRAAARAHREPLFKYFKQQIKERWKMIQVTAGLNIETGSLSDKEIQFQRLRSARRLMVINALVMPVWFLFLSTDRSVQANWVFPSYPAMLMVMAYYIPPLDRGRIMRTLRYAYITTVAVGLLIVLGMDAFIISGTTIVRKTQWNISPYLIPGYRLDGFQEIIERLEAERERTDPEAGLLAQRYQDAAVAQWYNQKREFVGSAAIMERSQYSYWPALEEGHNYFFVYINENPGIKMATFFEAVLEYMFEKVEPYPEMEVVRDGRVIKRFKIWYLQNYMYSWHKPLVDYMNTGAILHLMPGLQEEASSLTGAENQKKNQEIFQRMYASNQGCMMMQKPDSILERIRNLIETGSEGVCVEFNPLDFYGTDPASNNNGEGR